MSVRMVAYIVDGETPIVPGSTVNIRLEVRDVDTWALTDLASAPTLTVVDPTNTTVVNAASSTALSTGRYSYDYASSITGVNGTYKATFAGQLGGVTERADVRFVIR